MATPEAQLLVDASEDDAAARYDRRREFARDLADAVRRADVLSRLELTLRHSPGFNQTSIRHGSGRIEREGAA